MGEWNQQRQADRGRDGRYRNMPPCPRCGKRKCLEPFYEPLEGEPGHGSKWGGLFICAKCIKEETKS